MIAFLAYTRFLVILLKNLLWKVEFENLLLMTYQNGTKALKMLIFLSYPFSQQYCFSNITVQGYICQVIPKEDIFYRFLSLDQQLLWLQSNKLCLGCWFYSSIVKFKRKTQTYHAPNELFRVTFHLSLKQIPNNLYTLI